MVTGHLISKNSPKYLAPCHNLGVERLQMIHYKRCNKEKENALAQVFLVLHSRPSLGPQPQGLNKKESTKNFKKAWF